MNKKNRRLASSVEKRARESSPGLLFAILSGVLFSGCHPGGEPRIENGKKQRTADYVRYFATELNRLHAAWGEFVQRNSTKDTELSESELRMIFPSAGEREIRDPWGLPYHAILDTDGNGSIDVGGERIKENVVAWSCGPNKRNEFGKGDDIRSW